MSKNVLSDKSLKGISFVSDFFDRTWRMIRGEQLIKIQKIPLRNDRLSSAVKSENLLKFLSQKFSMYGWLRTQEQNDILQFKL